MQYKLKCNRSLQCLSKSSKFKSLCKFKRRWAKWKHCYIFVVESKVMLIECKENDSREFEELVAEEDVHEFILPKQAKDNK